MNRYVLAVLLVVMAGPALALEPVIYGDNEYCATYQTNPELSDTGTPSVFDGKTIGGQDWQCDLKGRCEGEGQKFTDKFSVSMTEDKSAVVITYPDGRSYTLHRCSRN
jgi:hypothetical protein